MPSCSNGHDMQERSRTRSKETVEEVVYTKQKIKHFNREGSEFWAETSIPDLVEKTVEFDNIEYECVACNESKTVKEELG